MATKVTKKRSAKALTDIRRQEANMAGVDAQNARAIRSAESVARKQHGAAVDMLDELSSLALDLDVDPEGARSQMVRSNRFKQAAKVAADTNPKKQ